MGAEDGAKVAGPRAEDARTRGRELFSILQRAPNDFAQGVGAQCWHLNLRS